MVSMIIRSSSRDIFAKYVIFDTFRHAYTYYYMLFKLHDIR